MNILLAMPWDQRTGGVTHVAASLASSLRARGHGIRFLYPADNGFRVTEGTSRRGLPAVYCRLRSYPAAQSSWRSRLSWYSTVLSALPQLKRLTRMWKIDVINVHYPDYALTLLVDLARSLDVPLIVSAHGSDLLPDGTLEHGEGLARQLDSASAVVVPSQAYLHSVVEAFPALAGKIRCIYNGYDEQEVSGIKENIRPSRKDGEVVAVCIAALIPKKGIDILLRALQLSKATQLSVRIIGEGPLRKDLESMSIELGLSKRVIFLGSKNRVDVLNELAQCDLLVMPSRHRSESFGLAALEAMACGKPVVASAIGGLQELVEDQNNGLLVIPENPQSLATALDDISSDPIMRNRLGEAGRIKARQFTVRATTDRYEAMFSELLAR
jgi:glycosyltransferase involved in cell wall biosynthesis